MNIILTLTTIPNRLLEPHEHMGCRHALQTIVEQSYTNYEIHFNIPYISKTDNFNIELPEWLIDMQQRYNHLKIFRCEDYGPITKILPTLERTNDPETIIIVVDDDLYYMNGLIEAHLAGREKYPNAALGFAGIGAIDGSCHFCTTIQKDTRVKILEGYKSVSYLRSFFDLDELKNNFLNKSWRDDETLSAYMGYKNIPKIVLSYDGDTDFRPRVESFPVINHVPVERGGCYIYRNSLEHDTLSQKSINEWYANGYLER